MRNCKTLNIASIRGGGLFFEDVEQASVGTELFFDIIEDKTVKAIRCVGWLSSWQETYWNGAGFSTATLNTEMTLRAEDRSGTRYWYAYRRAGGKLQKRFVGKSEAVTEQRLVKVAASMQ